MTYEFFQHMISGDVFAVAINERGAVVRSIGPLHYTDMAHNPADFAQNMEPWDNESFNDTNDWRLLESAEALQKANR